MLELKNISFERDNKKILDNINLKLEKGNVYVLTGANGSGKSTLAKIIMGILNQDKGTIKLDKTDISNMSIDERANLGLAYSFQNPVKFKGITVCELLRIASPKYLLRDEVLDILSDVGLESNLYIDREVNDSLSGGELKRIEIASVMLRECKVCIFDEPEAGIDLWSFNNLVNLFKKLKENNDGITLIISHQEKLFKIADKIILMNNGKILGIGNKDEMKSFLDGDTNE